MLKQTAGIQYASSSILESIDFISHGFLSRIGGISKPPFASLNFDMRDGDNIANIEHTKAAVGRLFGFDVKRLLTINQVHGSDILVIDKPVKDILNLSKTSADAIITNQYDFAIGILTADCVPILLLDPVKKVIGAVHAGWKGTVKTVVQKAIDTMVKQFGSDKKEILAAIGPSIGQCCYKVDGAVAKEFRGNEFIIPRPILRMGAPPPLKKGESKGDLAKEGRGDSCWQLDLKKANLSQMANSGILEKNISVEDLCTSCRNDLFFSYRADNKKTGRQLNFIMLKGS
ncbi:MAG: peptidoglycan editing factor PgeF [Deltaproteobacteria bacterium]|nr:peptidoglycan editing factor PgeF [Deltaproteobacteria bacterium]